MKRIARVFHWVALALLSAVFLVSGAGKALDPTAFVSTLLNSPGLSDYTFQPLLPAFGHYLPWFEITLGVALWIPPVRRASLFLLGALLVLFSAYLGVLAWSGLDLPCGCFGDLLPFNSTAWSLARNAFLLLCVAVAATGFRQHPTAKFHGDVSHQTHS